MEPALLQAAPLCSVSRLGRGSNKVDQFIQIMAYLPFAIERHPFCAGRGRVAFEAEIMLPLLCGARTATPRNRWSKTGGSG